MCIRDSIYPESVKRNYNHFTKPLCSIFNAVKNQRSWPKDCKTEYQTCIPKTSRPQSVEELRNISCTNCFSKVLELYILKEARKSVKLKANQFGGEPGVSTTHMLAHVWERVTSDLEDNRAASILTAIDYSKAFNRLEHLPCLQAVACKGAGGNV